jgi:hypothetical protein
MKIILIALMIGTLFQSYRVLSMPEEPCKSAIIAEEGCVSVTKHGPRFWVRR